MIPLPVILAEIIMALGGALLVGNGAAVIRSRRGGAKNGAQVQARGRVLVMMLLGLVIFVWGLATFVVRLHTKS
jgi:hypothetical protein